ncbi:hypothetical protein ABZW03_09910 [Kitasatospora sp. NPDC004799]|uniref:hypothetical protein n=1 Tax=Kitasatospora sp. NPDC004799 TaxID=3154460 RepID=UPI0033AE191E
MNDRTSPKYTVGATVHLRAPHKKVGETIANGFLNSAATVLVPDPPELLGDPWHRFVVRISRTPDPGGGVETILVSGLNLAALSADHVKAVAAVLPLAKASRHTEAVPDINADDLAASVRRHDGDLWAAYADLGYPVERPIDQFPPPPADWWLDRATSDFQTFSCSVCCPGNCCSRCH